MSGDDLVQASSVLTFGEYPDATISLLIRT